MDDDDQPDLNVEKAGDAECAGGRREVVEPRAAFEELNRLVLGDQSLTAVLQRVAELARDTIAGTQEVSVTLMREHQAPETVVFTGSLANALDERQYDAGFGPCLDAAVSGRTIAVANADPASPYPEFSRISLRSGVSHSLSVGLPVPQRIVGALNMYGAGEMAFDEEAVLLAETFAGHAAVAIANAQLYNSTANLVAQMQLAMESRGTIEQAKGIIMGRNPVQRRRGLHDHLDHVPGPQTRSCATSPRRSSTGPRQPRRPDPPSPGRIDRPRTRRPGRVSSRS